ncbi:helix-turn-helix transcriptional regulator [Pseudomonas anguilliseptica]|uniref:helix-turn-helix transcriptional regulator n=1 Tax=Pseudomonas anguilliseptica TaxID=53406 RepID=UPI0022AEFA6E|nr:AlpA family phage regulatory protein [Pseudomonas anguilliseptica]MCZ4321420.1 AlpA family phage regulatory protein [Pseudomonas anguilliseptica]
MATTTPTDTLIRLPEVTKKTGLSKSTIRRLMKDKKFPEQKKLLDSEARNSPVAWSLNEVQAWIEERKNANTAAVA